MKKSLTRKLAIAIIALVFAVVSLSTSTYAWFTISDTAKINSFEAQVKAAQGIEIAVTSTSTLGDAQWYTGEVPTNIIQGVVGDVIFDAAHPTAFTYEDTKFQDLEKNEIQTKGWVSFYVHIKAAQNGTLKVDGIQFTSKDENGNEPEAWNVTVPFKDASGTQSYTVNQDVQYKVENAARVAFVENDNSCVVYEKDAETATASYSGNSVNYVLATNKWVPNTENLTYDGKGAYQYYDAINPNNPLDPANCTNKYETKKINDELSQPTDGLGTDLLTLQAGVVQTVQVLVWVEGWDLFLPA